MHQLRAGIKRIIWFLFILWCVFSATLWFQAKQAMQTLSTLNELGSKVEEVRNFFNFELPYRVKHVDQVSLKLQLVYAVRLQLESEVSDANGPDVTQLLYSTDRFLESARAFIGSDGELVSLAEQLHTSRGAENNSQQIENMYYRLGALVLESILAIPTPIRIPIANWIYCSSNRIHCRQGSVLHFNVDSHKPQVFLRRMRRAVIWRISY